MNALCKRARKKKAFKINVALGSKTKPTKIYTNKKNKLWERLLELNIRVYLPQIHFGSRTENLAITNQLTRYFVSIKQICWFSTRISKKKKKRWLDIVTRCCHSYIKGYKIKSVFQKKKGSIISLPWRVTYFSHKIVKTIDPN